MMEILKSNFGSLPEGRPVDKYTLKNDHGMEVEIITFGAIVTSLRVPDKDHLPGDVVLGFDRLEEYLENPPYLGAMIGRVCNRIGKARFEIEGRLYRLTANHGPHQLHGGEKGFDKRIWTAVPAKQPGEVSLTMGYESEDGEEGYPGHVLAEVTYTLNDQNELVIACRAKSDKPTHVNLTNHSYFNLNGMEGDILDHELFIDADRITELDQESIPTGRILPVEGTPYDFRLSRPIGERIGEVDPGYDINYVLDMAPRELQRVAAVYDPSSGRLMEVLTTLPGVQLYTSNYLNGIAGKEGKNYGRHCAVCLETQFFPDTPNQPSFPSTLLLPGREYEAVTIYRFGTQHG